MRLAFVALLAGCDGVFGLIEVHQPDAAEMPDLIAHFRLDEPGPPMYVDTSGGHLGTCVDPRCPIATPGRIGNGAAHFDGIDDRIDIAGADEFDGTQAFTVALWLLADALPAVSDGCPAGKRVGLSNRNSWQLCLHQTGQLVFWSSEQNLDPITSPAPISVGAWHHVAMRWDGTTKILSIDGIDVAARATVIQFDSGPIFIGSDVDIGLTKAPFGGAVDDVRIYNRALSSAEITMLAQQ